MTEMRWSSSLTRLRRVFTEFRKVRKKAITKEKASKARVKAYTGKAPFTLAGFIMVCDKALEVKAHARMHIWPFMILAWNLCARSVNVAQLRWSNMSLDSDCIRIHFDKTKTMQGGEAAKHPKHVFANPLQPEICSFLSLGTFILRDGVQAENDRLFSDKAGNLRGAS